MSTSIPDITQSPHFKQIIKVAETHELEFLARLRDKVQRDGPDGVLVRNWGEAAALSVLIEVLAQDKERAA